MPSDDWKEFVPDQKLKDLHEVELDLLARFKDICSRHGLRYYACAGTLLGAVRHRGFIPWDDDIDVSMPWEDYKKLLEVGPQECRWPYFFQSHITEPWSEADHLKIRRSDTTGFSRWEQRNIRDPEHNRGIWFDVFPVFSVPADEEVRKEKKKEILAYWRAIRGHNALQCIECGAEPDPEYAKYTDEYRALEAQGLDIQRIKELYLEACDWPDDASEEVGETSFRTFNEKFIWRREWSEKTIELPFEDTVIACPAGYDEMLTKMYGDWRTPVYSSAVHEMEYIDTKLPYKEYFSRKSAGETV